MCGAGKLSLSDCGPVWQIGIIAVILICRDRVLDRA